MFFIILLFPLLFLACGEAELKIDNAEYKKERELSYNHWLLKAYFYRPERVKKYEEYIGMEVDSMYESLKDYFCGANHVGDCPYRYTLYYPPKKSDDKIGEIENTKKYYSFGFERGRILNDDESVDLIVSTVYPISPAFDVGLRKRDRLLSANGIPLTGLTKESADAYLKDDEQFENSTSFEVLRDGEIKILPAMQKKEVQIPTVYLDSIEGIPYIRITEYKVNTNNPNGTYAEFKAILREVKGAKAAIMDLRGNPGGNIRHCTAMAAELVPLNSELLYDVYHYYDNKLGNAIDISSDFASDYLTEEGEGVNIKWVILMSRGSASCSERFTAAVKYNRPETMVIGQTSYGKGVGQIYTKTYLGGLAYITCLQTYYPDGTTFHNTGIIPDIPTEPGDINALRDAAIGAAQSFIGLAKRSHISASLEPLPPERSAENMEPGAHRRIEMPLFHQWE
jgi:C-terminal peptidase prc